MCVRERERERDREGMRERRRAEERSDCVRCSVMSASVTLCAVALQAPLSMGFSRQEYWSGCHFLLRCVWGSATNL